MEITINHKYSQAEALEKMKTFLTKLKTEHQDKVGGIQENWNGNEGDYSCSFNGMNLAGHIKVSDGKVIVNGKVPFLLKPFESLIENTIRNEANKVLK
ncbi:MAG: polyhydroxyalkanoic acid system family protein [Bacteroidales bacterium]|nr:polyhydroxyalkanoic acid system family protein [Bacteroidales bacterium]